MWEENDEGIIRRSLSFAFMTGWSNSSRLFLRKSLSSSSATVLQRPTAGYRRLSQSMKLFSEKEGEENETSSGIKQRRRHGGGWFWRVLTIRCGVYSGLAGGRSTACSMEKSTERKERRTMSSWLPDPDRRWPAQGW